MAKAQRKLHVSYPVAMTRKVTLFHHLTQVHYQRFFQQASTRMASIQGLHVNPDKDDEIEQLEEVFTSVLDDALQSLTEQQANWTARLEAVGIDPNLDDMQGGEPFDAPLTTPWGSKLLRVYLGTDRVLLLVERAWVGEELGGVLEKREATNRARAPMVECARQIQRAVTQAFQEARRREDHIAAPTLYGDAGKHLLKVAAEALTALKAADARDVEAFRTLADQLKAQHPDAETGEAIEDVFAVRVALAKRRDGAEAKQTPEPPGDGQTGDGEVPATRKPAKRRVREAAATDADGASAATA